MNMTLSKRGDYVMRAAIFLARTSRETPRKLREVVADTEVPAAFAPQILADLVRAGIAVSKAGRGGGYQLSRDPSLISALEIVEAAEGTLAAERCALGEGPCKWDAVCPLHETWFAATQRVREQLAQTTLEELTIRDIAIEEGTYAPVDSHRRSPRQVEVTDVVHVERSAYQASATLATQRIDVGGLVEAAFAGIGAGPASSIEVEAAVQPVRSASAPDSSSDADFQMVWRMQSPDWSFRVEADLIIAPIDNERCEITMRTLWHEERGSMLVVDRARQISRAFLRHLSTAIEGPVAAFELE